MDPFILKKAASNLVQFIPAIPILLLVYSLALPRMRGFVASIALCLLVLSSPPASNALVRALEDTHPPLIQPPANTRAIAVLGYGHTEQPNRAPNSVLMAGALSRLSEAVRLWHLAPSAQLILSGGYMWNEHNYTHAEAMARAAIQLGVSEEKITLLKNGRDTAEEASLMRKLSDSGQFIIVTSATHMPRAVKLLKNGGIQPVAAPTDFLALPAPWWRFSAYYLHNADRALHEYVGMLWQLLHRAP